MKRLIPAGYVRRAHRVVYENPWLRFEAHEIVHPNGTPGEHGLVVNAVSSAVVLVDGDDVLLVRQARFAIDEVALEVVKGGCAPGETAQQAAMREAREEAGLAAARWDALGEAWEIPSIVREPVHLFLARELSRAPLAAEAQEQIDVVRVPLAEALAGCIDGRLNDAVTVVALLRAAHRLGVRA